MKNLFKISVHLDPRFGKQRAISPGRRQRLPCSTTVALLVLHAKAFWENLSASTRLRRSDATVVSLPGSQYGRHHNDWETMEWMVLILDGKPEIIVHINLLKRKLFQSRRQC